MQATHGRACCGCNRLSLAYRPWAPDPCSVRRLNHRSCATDKGPGRPRIGTPSTTLLWSSTNDFFPMPTLDQILDALGKHHQRATYGAIGALLGVPAKSVLTGHPRDHRHCWVVRASDGQPTGYTEAQKHPALTSRPHIISSADELDSWLRAPS